MASEKAGEFGSVRCVADGEFLIFAFVPAPGLRKAMKLEASDSAEVELCRVKEFLVRHETAFAGHSELLEDLGMAFKLYFGRMLARADGRLVAAPPMVCRRCGCHDTRACSTPDGPCYWVEPGLCSACVGAVGAEERARGAGAT